MPTPNIYLGDEGYPESGAMVAIELDDGTKLFRPYVSGEGLSSDSSHVIIVGLGEQQADKVSVRYINGQTNERSGPFRNQTISFEVQ